MTDERDEILDDVARALAVEPSGDFEAHVRVAIESRGTGRGVPWPAVAGIVVAAAAAGLLVLRTHGGGGGVAPAGPSVESVRAPVDPPSQTAPAGRDVRGAAPRRSAPREPAVSVSAARRAAPPREPDVLVSPDQAIALRKLLDGVEGGGVAPWAVVPDGDVVIPPVSAPPPVVVRELPVQPLPAPVESAS